MTNQPNNELESYKKCFSSLSQENCIFHRVLHVLGIVANSKAGIGEVMQDYAQQAHTQLTSVVTAGEHLLNSQPSEEDLEVLHNAEHIIKTVSRFLQLTPAAMKRNNAETIGSKTERFSPDTIEELSDTFTNSPETQFLLARQNVQN